MVEQSPEEGGTSKLETPTIHMHNINDKLYLKKNFKRPQVMGNEVERVGPSTNVNKKSPKAKSTDRGTLVWTMKQDNRPGPNNQVDSSSALHYNQSYDCGLRSLPNKDPADIEIVALEKFHLQKCQEQIIENLEDVHYSDEEAKKLEEENLGQLVSE